MLYVPINDDRYFTQGLDDTLFQQTELYEAAAYEDMYSLLATTLPQKFSINLHDEIAQFMAAVPPAFNITVHEVIDVACYYYADWDSPVIATDDFINSQVIHSLKDALSVSGIPPLMVERELDRQVEMLNDTVKTFISLIIGILTRCNAPAVADFGSVYRLVEIDLVGNVYFALTPPEVINQIVEENTLATYKATQQHKELTGE